MLSISHRASLGQETPHRAESGSAALPAGFSEGFIGGCLRGIVGWLVQWRDDWRTLRRIAASEDHLVADHLVADHLVADHRLRDVGLADPRDPITAPAHRDRHGPDPKGMPIWPTIF